MLEEIIQENPGITYREAKELLKTELMTTVQQMTRDRLWDWIRELNHPYHNCEHGTWVMVALHDFLRNVKPEYAVTKPVKTLLSRSALYHDVGHSGATYRQQQRDVIGSNMSNEEWSALCAFENESLLHTNQEDIAFIEEHILSTAFGQSRKTLEVEFFWDKSKQQKLERPYAPQKVTQRLLALADVADFVKGWDHWLDRSLALNIEQKYITPNINYWIEKRLQYVETHIQPLLESLKDVFEEKYYNSLWESYQIIVGKLKELQNPLNPERTPLEEKIQQIKKCIELIKNCHKNPDGVK